METRTLAWIALSLAAIAVVGLAIHAGLTPTYGPVHEDPNDGPIRGTASDIRAFARWIRAGRWRAGPRELPAPETPALLAGATIITRPGIITPGTVLGLGVIP